MAHAFAPAAVELKKLRDNLSSATFSAVFSASAMARASSLAAATGSEQRVQEVIQKALTEAHEVASFIQASHGRSVLDMINGLINLIEKPAAQTPR